MSKFALCLAAGILFSGLVLQAEEPTTATPEPKRAVGEKADTVFGDYRLLKNLTEEQKLKLNAIWLECRAKIEAMEKEREAQLQTVLSDEQKTELAKLREEAEIKDKKRAAERRKHEKEEIAAMKAELERLRAQLAATSQPAK